MMSDNTENNGGENVETNEQNVQQPTLEDLQNQIAALTSERDTLRKKADDAVKEAKGFKAKAKDAQKDEETIETVRSQMQTELDSRNTAYDALVNRLRDGAVANEVTKALTDAKCLSAKLMAREVLDRIESVYDAETGETKITVKGDDGKPMFVKGKDATVADLVTMLRDHDDFSAMFEGVQSGGSGSQAPRSITSGKEVENPFKTGNRDAQYALKAQNPALFDRLKKEHDASKKTKGTFAFGMKN